jgi:DNA-binding XRE family transcriptional regulator
MARSLHTRPSDPLAPRPDNATVLAVSRLLQWIHRLFTHRLRLATISRDARDIRIRFGRAIRRIREAQKINQEEAAERCGLHRTYYSGVERGIRNVSLVNIEKIAKGLKKSLPELFSRV